MCKKNKNIRLVLPLILSVLSVVYLIVMYAFFIKYNSFMEIPKEYVNITRMATLFFSSMAITSLLHIDCDLVNIKYKKLISNVSIYSSIIICYELLKFYSINILNIKFLYLLCKNFSFDVVLLYGKFDNILSIFLIFILSHLMLLLIYYIIKLLFYIKRTKIQYIFLRSFKFNDIIRIFEYNISLGYIYKTVP